MIKTIQNHPDYKHRQFSLSEFPFDEYNATWQQILVEYNKIPSVELWSFESLNTIINQIIYYKDANLFEKGEDFEIILNSMEKMLTHLQRQAEIGIKFMPGAIEPTYKVPYKFYINEVIIGNNTILVRLDDNLYCYINYNILNYLKTKDSRFTTQSLDYFQTLLSRSTLISGTGEKYRNKFFSYMRDKVNKLRN